MCFYRNFAGERVENLNELQLNKNVDQVVKLRNGKELSCDMVISCIGTKVNNEFYKQDLGEFLQVNLICVVISSFCLKGLFLCNEPFFNFFKEFERCRLQKKLEGCVQRLLLPPEYAAYTCISFYWHQAIPLLSSSLKIQLLNLLFYCFFQLTALMKWVH